ncbi:hypothetical protein XOC_0629 [Xanthomonas oryzae pv. oryzicola BLS256]|uniref:Uncharacterized protein n=1 Tax=Xanthomonas oryzae pv. oryzicola (strain BLS256) TaxID=383407 RepID=G7TBF7_XANOB|nr:hypothetical protein XOC_0629 [Xanthomonas oryzae pv. oryzicola BLS256]
MLTMWSTRFLHALAVLCHCASRHQRRMPAASTAHRFLLVLTNARAGMDRQAPAFALHQSVGA